MPSRTASARLGLSLCLAALLAGVACQRRPPPAPEPASSQDAVADVVDGVATGAGPVLPETPGTTGGAGVEKDPSRAPIDWSPVSLGSGQAWLSCDLDYSRQGDGVRVRALSRKALASQLRACADHDVLRLRYRGRIASDFVSLVERVARVADGLGIGNRVLDVDSNGGQVEDAIRAGDFIAGSRWTLWVREDSVCHSACVFLLSAGDVRRIAGKVGIHRIIRTSSMATTRGELNAGLRRLQVRVRDYLQRNGSSVVVADLMMAVPSRDVRMLSPEELRRFGLDGVNPAQDDLDRLRLRRQCGGDFVSRRDAFARVFNRQCGEDVGKIEELNACGLALRGKFGFPDSTCPAESPLSEFDLAQAEPETDTGQ